MIRKCFALIAFGSNIFGVDLFFLAVELFDSRYIVINECICLLILIDLMMLDLLFASFEMAQVVCFGFSLRARRFAYE